MMSVLPPGRPSLFPSSRRPAVAILLDVSYIPFPFLFFVIKRRRWRVWRRQDRQHVRPQERRWHGRHGLRLGTHSLPRLRALQGADQASHPPAIPLGSPLLLPPPDLGGIPHPGGDWKHEHQQHIEQDLVHPTRSVRYHPRQRPQCRAHQQHRTIARSPRFLHRGTMELLRRLQWPGRDELLSSPDALLVQPRSNRPEPAAGRSYHRPPRRNQHHPRPNPSCLHLDVRPVPHRPHPRLHRNLPPPPQRLHALALAPPQHHHLHRRPPHHRRSNHCNHHVHHHAKRHHLGHRTEHPSQHRNANVCFHVDRRHRERVGVCYSAGHVLLLCESEGCEKGPEEGE